MTGDKIRVFTGLGGAAIALTLSFAPASALTQCKPAVTGAATGTQDAAVQAWRQQVTSGDGSAWANFDLAKNKQYSEANLALAIMYFVTADPCRHIIIGAIGAQRSLIKNP